MVDNIVDSWKMGARNTTNAEQGIGRLSARLVELYRRCTTDSVQYCNNFAVRFTKFYADLHRRIGKGGIREWLLKLK